MWTLEESGWPNDEVTTTVTDWLLTKQNKDGYWTCSSDRPPSEASDWTTTYLALQALAAFGTEEQRAAFERATTAAATWLADAEAKDTEDQVFRLLSLGYVEIPDEVVAEAIQRLDKLLPSITDKDLKEQTLYRLGWCHFNKADAARAAVTFDSDFSGS